ncbi:TPA: hypothetical protein RQN15_002185 [Aeromonas hydrophila]|nr:hypothetical protein [Aeromonas hydrophila]
MNLNTYATEISLSTGKDRGNCYKALKTLLAKIEQDEITSLSYNLDFTEVTINDVRFIQDARKHWKQSNVHQQKSVVKTVEVSHSSATPVKQDDQIIALAASDEIQMKRDLESINQAYSMMCFFGDQVTKPEEYVPTQFDNVVRGPDGRPILDEFGKPIIANLPPVKNEPDECVNEPSNFDTSKCVFGVEQYKDQLISLYIKRGHSEEDAEINANAQLNAFSIRNDPDLSGKYEKVSDDSFMFNGKTVKFAEEDKEWK